MAKALFKGSDSKSSLIRLASLVAIALGVFGIIIGAALLYGSMQGQLATEQASRAASDMARNISDALSDIQATLRDPQVQEYAREVGVDARGRSDALEAAVRSRGIANIIDLRAFPAAIEDIPLGVYPEPDFTVIEMLLEARRGGRATIQVHYPGTGNENLAFAQAISDGNQTAGIVFLRVPVSVVTSLLQGSALLDSAALVQGSESQSVTLKSLGGSSQGTEFTDIPGSRLRLRWSRQTIVGPFSTRVAIITGAVGIILLMTGLLVRQRTGIADAHLAADNYRNEPEPPRQARQETAKPPTPAKPKPAKPAPRKPAVQEPVDDLPDWLLDSDQIDQHDSLFGEHESAADDLPDLPDTLADEDLSLIDQSEKSSRPSPAETATDTLFMDPDEPDLFEPEETPESSSGPDPSGNKDDALDLSLDEAAADLDRALDEDRGYDFSDRDESESTSSRELELELESEPETEPEPDLELEPELEPEPEPEPELAPEPEPAAKAAPDRPPVLDPALFHSSHIGGVVEDSLDARSATMIGEAIGSEARARGIERMVVGRDGRLYGAVLMSALSQGLRAAGIHVIDVGAVPIPVLNFAASELADGSGVMVTGSHYPPEYNGFCIRLNHQVLHDDGIHGLFRRIQEQDLVSGQGTIEEQNIVERYAERIGIEIQLERPLKVVIDCGNGITGTVAPEVLSAIGADVIPLYADVDGNFPNHHPNPADPDNLEDLKLCVRNFQADIGIAYDGDGDRLGVLSGDGEIVWPDRVLMLLAEDILERNGGARIVIDPGCSNKLNEKISAFSGRTVMARSANTFVGEKMRTEKALLAGLFSGHIFIAERWFPFDDAIYASARLLELLAADTRPIGEILAALPQSEATPEIRVPMDDEQALDLVTALIAEGDFGDGELSMVDGLRVDFPDGWGLVRASHTSPDLVLRFEADDAKALNRIKALFKKQIKAQDSKLKLLF